MPIFSYGYGRRRGGGGGGRWVIALIIALVGVIGYFSKEKVFNPETGESYRRAMNVDEQKALGLQAAKQMIPQMGGEVPPSRDADAALVDEVGERLVRSTRAAESEFADNFNFYLVDDPETVNAFALPGGQISITRGLMNRLENEAQLAGVLGHEIGHVIAEHSAQQMAKTQLGQMLATAVGVGASGEEGAGRYAGVAAAMATQMKLLQYGREHEQQSDEIGLRYMVQAGYDPSEMLGVMRILGEASKGGKQPEFLSSHPHPETRIATIKGFLQKNKDKLSKLKLTKGQSLKGSDLER
ncbi:MAG TPA: M48 family metallopeptidase [Tepidisphaeraceae bacterium]|nr:M48 family metallopeptidase [Tepidisphaeraceae bacterium]